MKRYILKKDLPTFKAGEEFFISEFGNLCRHDEDGRDGLPYGIVAYARSTLKLFPNILTEWFEEIPEKPKTVMDLKDGDECWEIALGDTNYNLDKIYFNAWDKRKREIGLIFLSKEEGEKELAWRKAQVILMRDTKGFKPNLEEKAQAFEVDYDCDNKVFECDVVLGFITHNGVFFRTKEDGEESIRKHEKEWKIYLGVEE